MGSKEAGFEPEDVVERPNEHRDEGAPLRPVRGGVPHTEHQLEELMQRPAARSGAPGER